MPSPLPHRVLLVTQDNRLRVSLRPASPPPGSPWEIAFADTGPEALAALAAQPCDAVFADLCLPGMRGADLLNEVQLRHPSALRFLLASPAEQPLPPEYASLPHQCLVKPDDAEALKTILHRVLVLEATLINPRLRVLLSKIDRLPSIPTLYLEIVESLQDPEVSVDDIGAIVSRDLAMTANILRLVNSALFGLRRQIVTPAEAVSYLGVEAVKSLVLTLQVFAQFDHARHCGFPIETLWDHSLAVGLAARALLRAEGAPRTQSEEGFVAGLLHDSGKLVLASNFPDHYEEIVRQLREHGTTLLEGERQFFQADHADVGGYLFGLWGLPASLVEAVGHHHHPARAQAPSLTPLGAVCLANELVQEPPPAQPSDPPCGRLASVLATFGHAHRLPAWREAVAAVLPART